MASTKDLEALRRLWTSTFAVPAAQLELWLRDPRRVLVERAEGEVVGACTLGALRVVDARREWRVVWLRALAVRADRRGRGHASRLVARALQLAQAHGCALALRSRPRDLYARAGLRLAGSVVGGVLASPPASDLRCARWSARLADARVVARASALATGLVAPLPGPRLRALARRGAGRALADQRAAGIVAREGVAWLAADSPASAAELVGALVGRSRTGPVRVDAHPALLAGLPQVAARDLGPWWCSLDGLGGDLPAAVLSCLD